MNVVNSQRHMQKNSCRYHHTGILHEKLETESHWLLRWHGKRNPGATWIHSVLWEKRWLSSKRWGEKAVSAPGAAKGRGFYKSQGGRQGNVSSTGEKLICCSGLMAGRNFSPYEPASGVKGKLGQLVATTHSGWWDLYVLSSPGDIWEMLFHYTASLEAKTKSHPCFFIAPLSADPVNRSIFVQGLQSGHWITLSPVQMGVLSLF